MRYADVSKAAIALLGATGLDARASGLESAVKSRIVRAHPWEQLMKTGQITYTSGSESISLNTAAYREMYRIVAIRVNSEIIDPPDYVTPAEWSRQKALDGANFSSVEVWTQIGRSFYTLAPLGKTFDVIYMRSPDQVGWGDLSDEFFDLAVLVLARMLSPLMLVLADGRQVLNEGRQQLYAEEQKALQEMIDVEYRQPGRDYQVRIDKIMMMRNEEEY